MASFGVNLRSWFASLAATAALLGGPAGILGTIPGRSRAVATQSPSTPTTPSDGAA